MPQSFTTLLAFCFLGVYMMNAKPILKNVVCVARQWNAESRRVIKSPNPSKHPRSGDL